jgi:hypothetical protein
MPNDNVYDVRDLTIRETPQLTSGGRTVVTTSVTFMVGNHGPFAITYAGDKPNAAKITADVTEVVNRIRSIDQAVGQLNQSTRVS